MYRTVECKKHRAFLNFNNSVRDIPFDSHVSFTNVAQHGNNIADDNKCFWKALKIEFFLYW